MALASFFVHFLSFLHVHGNALCILYPILLLPLLMNEQKQVLERPAAPARAATPPRPESPPDVGPYSKAENKRLKDLLLQRDNEISILSTVYSFIMALECSVK